MKLHELQSNEGTRKAGKRVGRGMASGHGKTSGKGHKGQNARTGKGTRVGFEGGQTPLFQRLPTRGYTNITRKEYAIVNLDSLNRLYENSASTPETLLGARVISKEKSGVKVLGNGTVEKKLTVKAHKFSTAAKEAIEAVGGKTEMI